MSLIKVAVLDDSLVDQKILQEWLKSHPQIVVVFVTGNAFQFEKEVRLKTAQIDVLLIDFYMPIMNGLELIQKFDSQLRLKCLLYSNGYPGSFEMLESLGIGGFSEKKKDILIHSIFEIQNGKRFFDIKYLNSYKISSGLDDTNINILDRLSAQEIEILNYLSCGLSYADISAKMNSLSSRSIETYLFQLRKRFGLKSNVQLLKWAMINGIIYRFDDLD